MPKAKRATRLPKGRVGRPPSDGSKENYTGAWVKVRIPLKREDVLSQTGLAHVAEMTISRRRA